MVKMSKFEKTFVDVLDHVLLHHVELKTRF